MRLSDDPGYLATRESVRPDLMELAGHVAKRGGPSNWPLAVPFGDESLLLSKLGQELVAEFPRPGGHELTEWRELTALALGLQAKILATLHLMASASDDHDQRAAVAGLADDASRGTQLAFTLHGEINTLTRAGALAEARDLAEIRRCLLERVSSARRIAPTDLRSERVSAGTGALVAPPLEAFDRDVALATKRPHAPAPVPRREVTQPHAPVKPAPPLSRQRPWHPPLAVALVVLLAALTLAQVCGRGDDGGTLSPVDLAAVPGFVQVIHRHPTVLVVVDQAVWERTPDAARHTAIAAIGRIAEKQGYEVAEVRSPSAQGLAWWRRGEGVSLPP